MGIALHFFLAAMFAWMLVEGWHLYLAIIKVLSTQKKSFLKRYYILGYGKILIRSFVRSLYCRSWKPTTSLVFFAVKDVMKRRHNIQQFCSLVNLSALIAMPKKIVWWRPGQDETDCNYSFRFTYRRDCLIHGYFLGQLWSRENVSYTVISIKLFIKRNICKMRYG